MEFVELILSLILGAFIILGVNISKHYKKNIKFKNFTFYINILNVLLVICLLFPLSFKLLNREFNIIRCVLAIIVLIFIGLVLIKILKLCIYSYSRKKKKNYYFICLLYPITLIISNLIFGISTQIILSLNLVNIIILFVIFAINNISFGMAAFYSFQSSYFKRKTTKLLICFSNTIGVLLSIFIFKSNILLSGIIMPFLVGIYIHLLIFELLPKIKEKNN